MNDFPGFSNIFFDQNSGLRQNGQLGASGKNPQDFLPE